MIMQSRDRLQASVVLATNKLSSYMPEVIKCLIQQTFGGDRYEIIVVDNNPSDSLFEFVSTARKLPGPEVRYVPEPRTGLHYARHAGAKAARGEIVVYTEDDILVSENWLSAMALEFEDPQVGMVGSKVALQFETDPPEWVARLDLNAYLSFFERGDKPFNVEPPDYVVANCAIRRSLLYKVGGFNPDGMGQADAALIWLRGDGESGLVRKVQEAGWIVRYTPLATAYHQIPASRCTMDYMLTREFTNAISGAFSYYRYHGITPYRVVRFVLGRIKDLTLAVGSGQLRKLKLRHEVTCLTYTVRMLLSPIMRSHIQRHTYLEEQDWPDEFRPQSRVELLTRN